MWRDTGVGGFYNFNMPYVRSFHFPSLATLSGNIYISSMPMLASLCEFWLPSSGLVSGSTVQLVSLPQLVSIPSWLVSAAGTGAPTGTVACTDLPPVAIHSAADYQRCA